MQIEGTVTKVLDEVTGEGKSGTWRKREFILETDGKYPKEICVTVWGDMVDDVADITGQTITADIDISSREYNGRYYTDVKAWKTVPQQQATPSASKDDGLPF